MEATGMFTALSIVVTVSLDKSSYKPSMQCGVASFKHRYSPNKTTDGVWFSLQIGNLAADPMLIWS